MTTLYKIFDHRPDNVAGGQMTLGTLLVTAVGYTCPIGYYARVNLSTVVLASGAVSGAVAADAYYKCTHQKSDKVTEFWLRPGDTITVEYAPLSSSDSNVAIGQAEYTSGVATLTVEINGNPVAQFVAEGTIEARAGAAALLATRSLASAATAWYSAEEFAEVSDD